MSNILITGTGLIGGELAKNLKQQGFSVRFLSQSKKQYQGFPCFHWNVDKDEIDEKALDSVTHIIHLAGAGITDKRWTESRKKELMDSRVRSGELLLKTLKKNNSTIRAFISASATGYYGAVTTDKIFSEDDDPANDFLSEICIAWENVAHRFEEVADQVTIFRFGIVLSEKGGALSRLTPIFRMGLGSPIGSGEQYMPWVHLDDLVNAIIYSIQNELQGTYNLVADEHVKNRTFSKALAASLNRKIILPAIPAFLLKLRFGELSIVLLFGSRISNDKLKTAGFNFKHKNLKSALNSTF